MISAVNLHSVSNARNNSSGRPQRFFLVACLVAAFALLALFFSGEPRVEMYSITNTSWPQEERCYSTQVYITPEPRFVPATDLVDLKKEIAQRNWSYPVNPDPKTPQQSNCIKQTQVEAL
jgi:hypothetical protein